MLTTPVRRFVVALATVSFLAAGALGPVSHVAAEPPSAAVATPDTEPPATEPPTDQAPPETAPAQPGAPSEPDADEGDGWLWFLALLALLVAGVAVVVSFLSRRDHPPTSGGGKVGAEAHREQHSIMGTAQWFHDQLSVQLIASPADQALARWQYERPRVQSIAAAANHQAIDADDPWHLLANSVLLLSAALDTLLGLQVQHPRNDDAVEEASNVAAARRRQLQALLVTMWPMVQTQ